MEEEVKRGLQLEEIEDEAQWQSFVCLQGLEELERGGAGADEVEAAKKEWEEANMWLRFVRGAQVEEGGDVAQTALWLLGQSKTGGAKASTEVQEAELAGSVGAAAYATREEQTTGEAETQAGSAMTEAGAAGAPRDSGATEAREGDGDGTTAVAAVAAAPEEDRRGWRRAVSVGDATSSADVPTGSAAGGGAAGEAAGGATCGTAGRSAEMATAEAAEVARFVAEEAAAAGAARRETSQVAWATAVTCTWLAALARERSRRRAAAVEVAEAKAVEVAEAKAAEVARAKVAWLQMAEKEAEGAMAGVAGAHVGQGMAGTAEAAGATKFAAKETVVMEAVDVSQWSASWWHRSRSSRVFDPGGRSKV
eukprot:SAG11_NODE_286_length_11220_cov_11.922399_5_plen_366_part_00